MAARLKIKEYGGKIVATGSDAADHDYKKSAEDALAQTLEFLNNRKGKKKMKKQELVQKRIEAVTLAGSLDEMVESGAKSFIAAQSGSMADTLSLAVAVSEIKTALTPDIMKPLMSLQGTAIGFKTDKTYPETVVKECTVEALLLGLPMAGNCVNIIAGRSYATKEGYTFLINNLAKAKTIKNFIFRLDPPRIEDGRTLVMGNAWWYQNGSERTLAFDIPIKTNGGSTDDNTLGKAERKLRKRAYEQMVGLTFSSEDIDDLGDFLGVASEVVEEPEEAIAEAPEAEAELEADSKVINTLKVLEKHRPEDFAAACVELNIPEALWADAPCEYLEKLLATLNA